MSQFFDYGLDTNDFKTNLPKPIVKDGRFLQLKATWFNPIVKKTTLTIKYSYKLFDWLHKLSYLLANIS